MTSVDYFGILRRRGLSPVLRGPWAAVGRTRRVQGWKLHVSSTPLGAPDLLLRLLPWLVRHKLPFKVAKDATVLALLNEGVLGPTQVGKFMTIYPSSDGQARQLARVAAERTRGFEGPTVVTDLRLGDVVYARYGGFNPVSVSDRLGRTFPCIRDRDGLLRTDTYEIPFAMPKGLPNPFADLVVDEPSASPAEAGHLQTASAKILGPGYLLLEVVRAGIKGSVFRGIDLRNQQTVGVKIIKQGRRHCLSDEHGRDMRTRLQRQEVLHRLLKDTIPLPKAEAYFEEKGDGYLPLEYIEGRTLEALVTSWLRHGTWAHLPSGRRRALVAFLRQVAEAILRLHAAGFVHRDLSVSNILIGRDERVHLLDLELTHRLDDPTPAFTMGTPGFMSPQQEAEERPNVADDIYALGCLFMFVFTGLDPRLLLFANPGCRPELILGLARGVPSDAVELAMRCIAPRPEARPDIRTIARALGRIPDSVSRRKRISGLPTMREARAIAETLLREGQRGLLEDVMMEEGSGLWLSSAMENGNHQAVKQLSGSYEIRRDANRGVAGAVYLLSRLAQFGFGAETARERVRLAASWLLRAEPPPGALPGLHFGEAGVAVALAEAIAAGYVTPGRRWQALMRNVLAGRVDWPDLTHGAAGQGLAALYCRERLGDPAWLSLAHRCARYLVTRQKRDGSWEMPPGVDGMSGETLTGFAHGVGGMVYFLAEYDRRFDDRAARRAWRAGARWLVDRAVRRGRALEWPYSDRHLDRWKWWCHGSPGIALTLLKLYECSGLGSYAEAARMALSVHPPELRYPNLSQCHGVSGLGEIYLEAWRVLGERQWRDRASRIAETLIHLGRRLEKGSVTWLVEEALPTADLMVGSAGVLHFLLRFYVGPDKVGLPLLPNPCAGLGGIDTKPRSREKDPGAPSLA